jgi:hypothetical protein
VQTIAAQGRAGQGRQATRVFPPGWALDRTSGADCSMSERPPDTMGQLMSYVHAVPTNPPRTPSHASLCCSLCHGRRRPVSSWALALADARHAAVLQPSSEGAAASPDIHQSTTAGALQWTLRKPDTHRRTPNEHAGSTGCPCKGKLRARHAPTPRQQLHSRAWGKKGEPTDAASAWLDSIFPSTRAGAGGTLLPLL